VDLFLQMGNYLDQPLVAGGLVNQVVEGGVSLDNHVKVIICINIDFEEGHFQLVHLLAGNPLRRKCSGKALQGRPDLKNINNILYGNTAT
jgi:hypothetical protein